MARRMVWSRSRTRDSFLADRRRAEESDAMDLASDCDMDMVRPPDTVRWLLPAAPAVAVPPGVLLPVGGWECKDDDEDDGDGDDDDAAVAPPLTADPPFRSTVDPQTAHRPSITAGW